MDYRANKIASPGETTALSLGGLIGRMDDHIQVASSILNTASGLADGLGGSVPSDVAGQPIEPDGGPLVLRLGRKLETLARLQTQIQEELGRAHRSL